MQRISKRISKTISKRLFGSSTSQKTIKTESEGVVPEVYFACDFRDSISTSFVTFLTAGLNEEGINCFDGDDWDDYQEETITTNVQNAKIVIVVGTINYIEEIDGISNVFLVREARIINKEKKNHTIPIAAEPDVIEYLNADLESGYAYNINVPEDDHTRYIKHWWTDFCSNSADVVPWDIYQRGGFSVEKRREFVEMIKRRPELN